MVPLPERDFVQLRAATPVGQNPPGAEHVVAIQRFTSAAEVAVQESEMDPEPPTAPGTTQLWGNPGERLGSSGWILVVAEGPDESKNSVRIDPAPSTRIRIPIATRPVRTERREGSPPNRVAGRPDQRRAPMRCVYTGMVSHVMP